MVVDACAHGAGSEPDIGHPGERRNRLVYPCVGGLAIDLSAVDRSAAAPMRSLFNKEDLVTLRGRRFRRRQTRNPAADDEDIGRDVHVFVVIGVPVPGRPPQTRRLTDDGLINVLPERTRPEERLVVEPGRQKA